jgi:phosphohistidine swiveling domain-containing protein
MKNVTFKKVYTRDVTVIIEQAWCTTLDIHRDLLGLSQYNSLIQTIHYLHDGMIEIWENAEWTPDLMNKILEKNRQSSELFDRYTSAHQDRVDYLKKYWTKGFATDVHELVAVVDSVFETMYFFDWMYYSAIDERTPTSIRNRALKMRDQDVYFDETDKFIRKSLVALYPRLTGFEQGILRNEIENPPPLGVLKERKRHFVVVGQQSNFLGTLKDFQKLQPELTFEELTVPAGVTELKGQVGNRGYVRGRVRIMGLKALIGEAQEGEILVSPMTTPDFLPAMKKAAAFVTDEGGMLSHAAIVAREMKKPCIVGTKFATQVFKDGDFVEVDANNGDVRILTKKQL